MTQVNLSFKTHIFFGNSYWVDFGEKWLKKFKMTVTPPGDHFGNLKIFSTVFLWAL